MADDINDPDRSAILARRQRFIALAISGLAVGCGDDGTTTTGSPMPCLDVGPAPTESVGATEQGDATETDDTSGTGGSADSGGSSATEGSGTTGASTDSGSETSGDVTGASSGSGSTGA